MQSSMFLILATSYLAWYMERFEIAMIYPFDATHTTPAVAGEPRLQESHLPTADGEKLVVWRSAAQVGKPTLVYLPGNAGTLKDRSERFGYLLDQGYGLTVLAYRGSSGSTGRPDELSLTEDALALVGSETGRPMILYGESLGTALAIKLAASGLGDAVVLEAPFTSVGDLVESQYPDEALAHLVTQHWNSIRDVPSVRQPLLVIHGTADKTVPIAMGRRIFADAGSLEKQFVEVIDQGHSTLWTETTRQVLFEFLDSH